MGVGSVAIFGIIGLSLFVPLVLGGFVVLQIFLSKRENKWVGLILPIILLGLSGLIFSGRLLYPSSWYNISAVLIGVIVFTPCAVLFVVHFICRCTRMPNNLDKMRIQDIE